MEFEKEDEDDGTRYFGCGIVFCWSYVSYPSFKNFDNYIDTKEKGLKAVFGDAFDPEKVD